MAITQGSTHEQSGSADWIEGLITDGALIGVDLEQRVVRWSAAAVELLGSAELALGRHCFEVTAAFDPRNAGRCRPNCAVIAAARHARAHPDFEVYLPPCAAADRARVSVLLARADASADLMVLHVVRPTSGAECEHQGPGEVGAMLQEAVRRDGSAPSAQAEASKLTERQREMLVRLARGESPTQIARGLGLSAVTVRNHIQAAMDRLGAHSRLEAVMSATIAGLL